MIPGRDYSAACKLYDRLSVVPVEWVRSPEGRQLVAKSLRHVQQHCSREQAAGLRDALYVAWGMGDCLPTLETIERRYHRKGGAE